MNRIDKVIKRGTEWYWLLLKQPSHNYTIWARNFFTFWTMFVSIVLWILGIYFVEWERPLDLLQWSFPWENSKWYFLLPHYCVYNDCASKKEMVMLLPCEGANTSAIKSARHMTVKFYLIITFADTRVITKISL